MTLQDLATGSKPHRRAVSEDRKRIGLLVLNESQWSRSILEGISRFADDSWEFWLAPRAYKNSNLLPSDWQGHGVIARVFNAEVEESIRRHQIPAVNVSWHRTHSDEVPKVLSDPAACGEVASQYYLDRGFAHCAYIGPPLIYGYTDPVRPAIDQTLEETGCQLHTFTADETAATPELDYSRPQLVKWLQGLPKPVGLITWSTILARDVILTCASQGIEVPDEVSVLAIEHDPVISELSPVPITYIEQRLSLVGMRAAEELKRLMEGGKPHSEPILIRPEGVCEEASTDTVFTRDDIVPAAVRLIRENARTGITVEELAFQLNVSRRSLEERFRRSLKKSPAAEIRRVRLRVLKQAIRSTTASLNEISYRSGFSGPNAMLRFFKRMTGMTPSEYRENHLS